MPWGVVAAIAGSVLAARQAAVEARDEEAVARFDAQLRGMGEALDKGLKEQREEAQRRLDYAKAIRAVRQLPTPALVLEDDWWRYLPGIVWAYLAVIS